MATIAGFVIGSVLARGLEDEDERARAALVGGLMPNPLLGAVVVSNIVEAAEDGDDRLGRTRSRAVLGSGRGSRRSGALTHRARRDAGEVATTELMEAWQKFEQAIDKAAERDQEFGRALAEFRKAVAGGDETDPDAARQSYVNAALASLPGIASAIERAAQAGASAAETAAAKAKGSGKSTGSPRQATAKTGAATSGQGGANKSQ
jgi:hypothetical protein